eukprot:3999486-Pleurochrysis_carterae.AAC.1
MGLRHASLHVDVRAQARAFVRIQMWGAHMDTLTETRRCVTRLRSRDEGTCKAEAARSGAGIESGGE